jgi:hypothetical protein
MLEESNKPAELRAQAGSQRPLTYEKPKLRHLGSLTEVTLGTSGLRPEGGFNKV